MAASTISYAVTICCGLTPTLQSQLMKNTNTVLATKHWLNTVIIGLNFCPFAKKEFVNNTIHYHLSNNTQLNAALTELVEQLFYLQQRDDLETALLIYPDGFGDFDDYLTLVDSGNVLLIESGFEGEFQLASMHPQYCFAGEDFDDASNFTNRSPYPMIHIIRESSMAKALSIYKEPEKIPENNIYLAKEKGNHYFESILKNIYIRYGNLTKS